jgi:tricorn protease-like protein
VNDPIKRASQMKIILLVVSLLCLITASSHAHDIYDAKNDFLYVGGRAYYYAQTTVGEEIDRSLISSIARFDIKGRKKIAFYTTDKSIELFKLSPNGKYIAINEVGLVNNIVILNFDGSPVTILEKTIGEFEWSPDSRYLAYITGKVTPEEQYPFKPESLWIYDIIQRKV